MNDYLFEISFLIQYRKYLDGHIFYRFLEGTEYVVIRQVCPHKPTRFLLRREEERIQAVINKKLG